MAGSFGKGTTFSRAGSQEFFCSAMRLAKCESHNEASRNVLDEAAQAAKDSGMRFLACWSTLGIANVKGLSGTTEVVPFPNGFELEFFQPVKHKTENRDARKFARERKTSSTSRRREPASRKPKALSIGAAWRNSPEARNFMR